MTEEFIEVQYNNDTILESLSSERHVEGDYALLLTSIENAISKGDPNKPGSGGSFMFKCGYRTLRDPTDASSAFGRTINHWVLLPFDNPTVDGHRAHPSFADRAHDWANAHMPEVVPLRGRGRDKASAVGMDARDKCFGALIDIRRKLYNKEDTGLLRTLVFATLSYDENSDFPRLSAWSSTADNKSLVDPEMALQRVRPRKEE